LLFSTFDGSCVIAWHPVAVGVGGFPGFAESIAVDPPSIEGVLPPSLAITDPSLPGGALPSDPNVGEALGSLEHPAAVRTQGRRTMCFRMRARLRRSARRAAIDRA
jgi:hypothetical protein